MTNFIIISIIANSIFCLFFSRISNFLNIFDKPDSDKKLHKKNVAAIGGVLFFINLIILCVISVTKINTNRTTVNAAGMPANIVCV